MRHAGRPAPRLLLRLPEGRGGDRAEAWAAAGSTPATWSARRRRQLHFVDRKKNMIRRSGENIAAVEVESVLNQHPAGQERGGGRDARRGARRRGAGLHRAPRDADRRSAARSAREPLVAHAWRSSRTTRRRATSPSSTRCRSRIPQKIQRGARRPPPCPPPALPRPPPGERARRVWWSASDTMDEEGGSVCRRRAGDGALRALFHAQRPLVHRPGPAGAVKEAGLRKDQIDGLTVSSLSLGAGHSGRRHAAPGCRRAGSTTFRPAAPPASCRCAAPPVPCRRATPRWWLVSSRTVRN